MEFNVKQIAGALVITIMAGALSEGGIRLQARIEPHTEVPTVGEYPPPSLVHGVLDGTTISGDRVAWGENIPRFCCEYRPRLYCA